jgi:hypothetical protein
VVVEVSCAEVIFMRWSSSGLCSPPAPNGSNRYRRLTTSSGSQSVRMFSHPWLANPLGEPGCFRSLPKGDIEQAAGADCGQAFTRPSRESGRDASVLLPH